MKGLLIAPLLVISSLANGGEFTQLAPQQSSITFVSRQMNVPVEGSFRRFAAEISVNPAKPESGKAHIEIDVASIDTGSSEVDEEVASSAWFDTKNHPIASFTANNIVRTGMRQYQAAGKMTIKGRTLDITAPFTLKQTGKVIVIEGAFPLKRLDFGIGTGIWDDTSVVADEVQIRFTLTVAKPNGPIHHQQAPKEGK